MKRKTSGRIIFVTLLLIISMISVSFAEVSKKMAYSLEKEYAMEFIQSLDKEPQFSGKVKELYNYRGKIESVLFELSESGYIIVNTNDYSIPELSLESNARIDWEKEYLYNGPLALVEFSESNAMKIEKLSYRYENDKKNKVDINQDSSISESQYNIEPLYSSTSGNLDHSLVTWDYNPDGRCGPLAAAIVLKYYDVNYDSDMIATQYQNSDEDLSDLLVTYMDGPSTYPADVRDGLNDYYSDNNLDYTATLYGTFSLTRLKAEIADNDNPVMIETDNHPTYREHWIIAHGYLSAAGYDYVYINNGWGDNDILINVDNYLDNQIIAK